MWWYCKSTNSIKMFTTKWVVSHKQSICSRTYCADKLLSWMLTYDNQGISVAVDLCLSFYSFPCTLLSKTTSQTAHIHRIKASRIWEVFLFLTEISVSKWCWQRLIAFRILMRHSCNHSSEYTLLHNFHTIHCAVYLVLFIVLCIWCWRGEGWEYVQVLGSLGWL